MTRVGWRTRGRSACEAMVGVRTWLSIASTPDSSCPAPPRTARWRRPQGWLHREHRPPCHQDRPPPRVAWASPAWLAVARAEHGSRVRAATGQTPWRGVGRATRALALPRHPRTAGCRNRACCSNDETFIRGRAMPWWVVCPRIGITTQAREIHCSAVATSSYARRRATALLSYDSTSMLLMSTCEPWSERVRCAAQVAHICTCCRSRMLTFLLLLISSAMVSTTLNDASSSTWANTQ